MMKYSDPTRPTPDNPPPPQGQQLPARFLEDCRQDSQPLRSSSGFPSPAFPPCFKRVRPSCAEVAMRHRVPPGTSPSPPPPHTPTIPIHVSSQLTKKQIKPLKKQNTEIPSHASSPHQSVFSKTKQAIVRPPQERFVVASSEALYLP